MVAQQTLPNVHYSVHTPPPPTLPLLVTPFSLDAYAWGDLDFDLPFLYQFYIGIFMVYWAILRKLFLFGYTHTCWLTTFRRCLVTKEKKRKYDVV